MTVWSYAPIEAALDRILADGDPDDPRERKRRAIADAATRLFVSQGFRKTSVGEIAAAAGVAKGTVYLYFETKTDLLIHAIAREKKEHLEQLRPILTDPELPARERLQRWISTVIVLSTQMPLVSRLMGEGAVIHEVLAKLPPELLSESVELVHAMLGPMVDAVAAPHGWNALELRDRTNVIRGAAYLGAMIGDPRIRGELSIERFAWVLAETLVRGLEATGAGSRHGASHDPVDPGASR